MKNIKLGALIGITLVSLVGCGGGDSGGTDSAARPDLSLSGDLTISIDLSTEARDMAVPANVDLLVHGDLEPTADLVNVEPNDLASSESNDLAANDLAMASDFAPNTDLIGPPDFAVLRDLAVLADLAPPSDLTPAADFTMPANGKQDMTHTPQFWTVLVGPGNTTTFSPSSLDVSVGDTVLWLWSTSGHNVVSGTNGVADNVFCSPNDTNCANAPTSTSGSTYAHTFSGAGTFPYFCKPHVNAGMVGTITVQ